MRLGVILDHGMRSREAGRVPPVTAWMNILPFLLDALDLIAVSLGALPVVNNRTVQEARIAAASAAPWASDA